MASLRYVSPNLDNDGGGHDQGAILSTNVIDLSMCAVVIPEVRR
jgi:hypothetical protein